MASHKIDDFRKLVIYDIMMMGRNEFGMRNPIINTQWLSMINFGATLNLLAKYGLSKIGNRHFERCDAY